MQTTDGNITFPFSESQSVVCNDRDFFVINNDEVQLPKINLDDFKKPEIDEFQQIVRGLNKQDQELFYQLAQEGVLPFKAKTDKPTSKRAEKAKTKVLKKYCELHNSFVECVDLGQIQLLNKGKMQLINTLNLVNNSLQPGNVIVQNNQLSVVIGQVDNMAQLCTIIFDYQGNSHVNLDTIQLQPASTQSQIISSIDNRYHKLISSISLLQTNRSGSVVISSYIQHVIHRICDSSVCFLNKIRNANGIALLADHIVNMHRIVNQRIRPQSLHLHKVTETNFIPNRLVIRNAEHWTYGDQDRSSSQILLNDQVVYLGRTVAQSQNSKICLIFWYSGRLDTYRIGFQNQFELLYYDPVINQDPVKGADLIAKLKVDNKQCACNYSLKADKINTNEGLFDLGPLFETADYQRLFKSDTYVQQTTCCSLDSRSTGIVDQYKQLKSLKYVGKYKKTSYRSNLHQFQEKYQASAKFSKRQLESNCMPTYASIPVLAQSTRAKLPALVTIGEDWHHMDQCSSKVGILIPSRKFAADGHVCVRWLNSFQQEIEQLMAKALNFQKQITKAIQNDGQIKMPPLETKTITYSCNYYEAGKNNLYEINYYSRVVNEDNFQPGRLVAPSIEWESGTELIGVLICQQNQFGVVYWLSGNVNRHRIGSNGKFELSYVDYI
ncbi:Mib_herc2_domain-containing protein [Hexamita inflata]|uniref:Mib_herc2 domain-containing protein n=1 Tax=Hexamita inflata TaxID=28002 RepID=A0AA86U6F7_9EUKA|nr:Mib_herc2 domain-containing protein [Hexamita inflata]